jgi:hypothetical protein
VSNLFGIEGSPTFARALGGVVVLPVCILASATSLIFRFRRSIRALVSSYLMVMLALIYFGGVTATQASLRNLIGQEQQLQLAIVS